MSAQGRLTEWHDAKGYGWIDAGGSRLFAHIRDFSPGQRRPVEGDRLIFSRGTDEKGRPRAVGIRQLDSQGRIGGPAWLLWLALLILPGAAAFRLPGPWWLLPALYTGASAIAWLLYALDKRKAQRGQWRIEEFTLQLAAACGGWPGAFLAQRRLRHKTVKRSFQATFWAIVLVHQVIAADFTFGRTISCHLLEAGQALLERVKAF